MNKKIVALVLACVLMFSVIVAGTLAFLIDNTTTITNTFTFGMVDIDLTETGASEGAKTFKLIPGETIAKDPTVTVNEGSEDSYVFIKVEPSANLGTYIDWAVDTTATGWKQLKNGDEDVANVYYREYAGSAAATYNVLTTGDGELANGKVTCKSTVTPADVTAAQSTPPTLAFTAYAIQKDDTSFTTAYGAWTAMNDQLA